MRWSFADGLRAERLGDWAVPADMRVSFNGGVLRLQPVPEPGIWTLWLVGFAALAGSWRRRSTHRG